MFIFGFGIRTNGRSINAVNSHSHNEFSIFSFFQMSGSDSTTTTTTTTSPLMTTTNHLLDRPNPHLNNRRKFSFPAALQSNLLGADIASGLSQNLTNSSAISARRRLSNVSDVVTRKLSNTIGWRSPQIPAQDIITQGKCLCGQYIRSRLKRSGVFNRKLGLQRIRSIVGTPTIQIMREVFPALSFVGEELERMHPRTYNGIARQISRAPGGDLQSPENASVLLGAVARDLFKTDITWGKVRVICILFDSADELRWWWLWRRLRNFYFQARVYLLWDFCTNIVFPAGDLAVRRQWRSRGGVRPARASGLFAETRRWCCGCHRGRVGDMDNGERRLDRLEFVRATDILGIHEIRMDCHSSRLSSGTVPAEFSAQIHWITSHSEYFVLIWIFE